MITINKIHKRRLYFLGLFVLLIGTGTALILYALKQNINVFVTPKQIASSQIAENYHFRLGGLVEKGSLTHEKNSLAVDFKVTDYSQTIRVHYVGVLPDLFKEGTGVIAEGSLKNGVFMATQVLAKHDENYMPKNVYKALRENNDTSIR